MSRAVENSPAGFAVGQRWASHADPELGLGMVTEIAWRRLTVSWPAVGETRTYATDSAPLSRIRYGEGERISDLDERSYTVIDVHEAQSLLTYVCEDDAGERHLVQEIDLNCFVQFTSPQQRLFSGQFDRNSRFELRLQTLHHLHRLQQSAVRGLLGSRTSLLPHQVYIAYEVARRHAPRVLLADEVGLGKTIEAGMILHQQLHADPSRRVLILVPDSLVHQWLVEMLRRFNLAFAIFDDSRIAALNRSETGNPFETEQRVICSLDFLSGNPALQEQALAAGWDLVVVDEAHHLQWSPQSSSAGYDCVEALARASAGLLLLTATPEQAGIDGHFARLRLIDPARFFDLEAFRREEDGYQALNRLLQGLLDASAIDDAEQRAELTALLGTDAVAQLDDADARAAAVRTLLDRHGTGRVLFRNTRDTVAGFPHRKVLPSPLQASADYRDAWRQRADEAGAAVDALLFPEHGLDEERWVGLDPRVDWLVAQLKGLKREKVLVICHHASTATALDKHLNLRAGIRSTLFHEGMSIVERDRAAAYFAETDAGAQTLVCSEIGSEGRNFQFAHHLVLFDLPLDPDLIEQRIGRLDRIGQQAEVHVHVPYIEDTAQAILFRWYEQGLNLFAQSCSAGFAIYARFATRLLDQLRRADADFESLLAATAEFAHTVEARQQAGRDRLLELNSCEPARAQALIESIEAEEQADTLEAFMGRVFDEFGVDQEFHSDRTLILRPGAHMADNHFPGLSADGVTVSFSRERALHREDMGFLSWEHPMVAETIDMIVAEGMGNAAVATISVKGLKPGSLLLEAVFTVQSQAPRALQLELYLPLNPVRLLYDVNGRDLGDLISHEQLNDFCQTVKKGIAQNIVEQVRQPVEHMINGAQAAVDQRLAAIQASARAAVQRQLGGELQRLGALRAVNPSVRDAELEFLEAQIKASEEFIARATMQLQGLRLLVTS